MAALGGLLFGYDTAVISGTTEYLEQHFRLNAIMLGWGVASALVGCIIGAISVGKPSDTFGRKSMLILMSILLFVSAVGTGLAGTFTIFVLARFIGGIGVGGASVLSPMYISEIAPARIRGRLVATAQLAIVIGIVSAFFMNFLLDKTGEHNWRYMFLAEAVPAAAFFFLLLGISESPRWLVKMGRLKSAYEVIQSVTHEDHVDQTLEEIRASMDNEIFAHSSALFRHPYLRLVLIGIAVGMFNQFTGINAIMYYAPRIFKEVGFGQNTALVQAVMVGSVNLIFTIIAMNLIDKIGRKTLLLIGTSSMSVFLGLFAFESFYKAGFFHKHLSMLFTSESYTDGFFGGYSLLVFILCFAAFFASSQGIVVWVILAEMFPNNIRARASSIGSFSLWVFCTLTSLVFPISMEKFGVGAVFSFYAVATLISFFFFKCFLVETKGKSLEELEKLMLKQ